MAQQRPQPGGGGGAPMGGGGMGGMQQPTGEEDYQPMKLRTEPLPKGIWIPSAITIGADVGGLFTSAINPELNRYELSADIDFHRFYLKADVGLGNANFQNANFEYTNNGHFYRVGLDIDFFHKDPDFNSMYIGFRYARSNFSDEVRFTRTDSLFGDFIFEGGNENVSMQWLEAVIGIKGQLLDNVYGGYSLRILFRPEYENIQSFTPYHVPGYGLGQFSSRLLFNYYIYYRIPFRKKVLVPLMKKR